MTVQTIIDAAIK